MGRKAGELHAMPLSNGQPTTTEAAQLAVITGEMSSANPTLVTDNKTPMVRAMMGLTFIMKDTRGNPVTGSKPDAPVSSGAASTGNGCPLAGN